MCAHRLHHHFEQNHTVTICSHRSSTLSSIFRWYTDPDQTRDISCVNLLSIY